MIKGLEEIRNPVGCEFSVLRKKYVYSEEQVNIIEKELKALDIIKEKQIDVLYLVTSNNLTQYNKHVSFVHNEWCLTQEEYDSLKEVLL